MTTKYLLLFISFGVLLTSCIPTLQPLYTAKDLTTNQSIEGTWVSGTSKQDQSTWIIERYDDCMATRGIEPYKHSHTNKLYILEHIQGGDTIIFELYLLKLGNYHYLDFYPLQYESVNEMRAMHLFPVHTFARVSFSEENMQLEHFDVDFLEELIQQNRIRIGHQKSGDNIILTASTEDLQKFVIKFSEDEQAFTDPTALNKVI